MAETVEDEFVNPKISQNLEEMWNNKEYSDTLFLVNDQQFHASSHLVSVSSAVLKDMISTHFENCGDKEIRIDEVKHSDSFSIILKFIHGIRINLKEMDVEVLCDVLFQAKRFELNSLSKKLKSFTSSIDEFEFDSFVILINTAKTLKMADLYKKLIIFAYQNADELVKHESFVNLKYDVLCEMLKTDYFYAQEVDILVGALNWHGDNFNKSSYDTDMMIGTENASMEASSVTEANETLKDSPTEDNIGVIDEENKDTIDSFLVENNSSSVINETESGTINLPNDGVVTKFSENILKYLLSLIRVKQIPYCDFQNALHAVSTKKYKQFIEKCELFSQALEPRAKYSVEEPFNNPKGESSVLKAGTSVTLPTKLDIKCSLSTDITKIFTIECPTQNSKYKSVEEYVIGSLKWKLLVNDTYDDLSCSSTATSLYLKCTSNSLSRWSCDIECQVRMLSNNQIRHPSRLLSDYTGCYPFQSATFSYCRSEVGLGSYKIPSSPRNWREIYQCDKKFRFEVQFLYVHETSKEIKQRSQE